MSRTTRPSDLLLFIIPVLAIFISIAMVHPALAGTGGNGVDDVNLTVVYESGQNTPPNGWSSSDTNGLKFKAEIVMPNGTMDTFTWESSNTTHIYSSLSDPSNPSSVAKKFRLYVTLSDGTTLMREFNSTIVKAMQTYNSGGEVDYAWLLPFPPPLSKPVTQVGIYVYDPGHVLDNITGWKLVLYGGDTSPYFTAVVSGDLGVETTSAGSAYTLSSAMANGRLYLAKLDNGERSIYLGQLKPVSSSVGMVIPLGTGVTNFKGASLFISYNSSSDEFLIGVNATTGGEVDLKNSSGIIAQYSVPGKGNYTFTFANASRANDVWAQYVTSGGTIAMAIGRASQPMEGTDLGLPVNVGGLVFIISAVAVFLAFTITSWPLGAILAAIVIGTGCYMGALPGQYSLFAAAAAVVAVLYLFSKGGGE